MRYLYNTIILALITCMVMFSCTKNSLHTSQLESTDSKSLLKIAYLSPSVTNQNVQVKINDQRVSGLISYSFGLPGGGTNIGGANTTDYLSVDAGQVKVSISLPKAGSNADSVALYSTILTLDAGKMNTLFITDTFPAISSFVVADSLSRPDSGFIKLRFVHSMPDIPAVDVYKNAQLLFSNVPFKGASGYATTNLGSDTFKIRVAGALPTATPVVTRVVATANQKEYTFLSRGYRSLSGTRGPQISNLVIY